MARDKKRALWDRPATQIETLRNCGSGPKLMTVATTILALLPIILDHRTGPEVMQRIAAPMVGGLVSSTVLTLIIVPVLFYWLGARKL